MANLQKYTIAQTGRMNAHDSRAKGADGNYIKYGNQNIDTERTYLNYNLAATDQPMKEMSFIHKRMDEVKHINRKDLIVQASWVVTLPKTLPADKEEQFFKETYDFLCKRYKKENVISAYVHRDETTPHIHFEFIPVYYQDGKEPRINFNKAVPRRDYQTFHKDLKKYLEEHLQCEVDILKPYPTSDNDKSINQIKREMEEVRRRIDAKMSDIESQKYGIFQNKVNRSDYEELSVLVGLYKDLIDKHEKRLGNAVSKINDKADSYDKEIDALRVERNKAIEECNLYKTKYENVINEYNSLNQKYNSVKQRLEMYEPEAHKHKQRYER